MSWTSETPLEASMPDAGTVGLVGVVTAGTTEVLDWLVPTDEDRLIIRHTESVEVDNPPWIEIHGFNYNQTNTASFIWSNTGSQYASTTWRKSRGTTIGTHAILHDQDYISGIEFFGSDGVEFLYGGGIYGAVYGAPGVGDLPTGMEFWTRAAGDATAGLSMLIKNAGLVSIGDSFDTAYDYVPIFQVNSNASNKDAAINLWSDDSPLSGGALFHINRSLSNTPGTHVAVVGGAYLGRLIFSGSDGTHFVPAASIIAQITADTGSDDMPGTLIFCTTSDGDSDTTERMRIDHTGLVTLSAGLKTAAPSGGTSGTWKLGVAASVSPTSPNRTIEVDIGGTIYYVHAKTTNN